MREDQTDRGSATDADAGSDAAGGPNAGAVPDVDAVPDGGNRREEIHPAKALLEDAAGL
jgi:hypothetical protein